MVQCTKGCVAAALNATGSLWVEESDVVPAVSVVFAAVISVPVDQPSDHPPAQVPIVVSTRRLAPEITDRVGIFAPKVVFAPLVLSVSVPESIRKRRRRRRCFARR